MKNVDSDAFIRLMLHNTQLNFIVCHIARVPFVFCVFLFYFILLSPQLEHDKAIYRGAQIYEPSIFRIN